MKTQLNECCVLSFTDSEQGDFFDATLSMGVDEEHS